MLLGFGGAYLMGKKRREAIVQRFFDFIKFGFIFCCKSIKFDLKPNTKTNFLFLRHGKLNQTLIEYLEQAILPRYAHFDAAHQRNHAEEVIAATAW